MKNGMAIGLKIFATLVVGVSALLFLVGLAIPDAVAGSYVVGGLSGAGFALLVFGFAALLQRVAEIEYHLRLMATGQPPGQPPVGGPNQPAGGMFTELKL